mmetsp:Transcript_13514/g.38963  ORF Transcript_13514/g.38963 Transcript_13514/m.38963 type:complete len:208 (-) Transcript_13514:122-745(-)
MYVHTSSAFMQPLQVVPHGPTRCPSPIRRPDVLHHFDPYNCQKHQKGNNRIPIQCPGQKFKEDLGSPNPRPIWADDKDHHPDWSVDNGRSEHDLIEEAHHRHSTVKIDVDTGQLNAAQRLSHQLPHGWRPQVPLLLQPLQLCLQVIELLLQCPDVLERRPFPLLGPRQAVSQGQAGVIFPLCPLVARRLFAMAAHDGPYCRIHRRQK